MAVDGCVIARSETVSEDSVGQWAEAGLDLCVHMQYIFSAQQQPDWAFITWATSQHCFQLKEGRFILEWGWWGIGKNCPERWYIPQTWRHLRSDWMGLWSIWYSGRYPWLLQGRWTKGPWKAPFQPKGVYGPLILWTATRWRALDILYIYIPMQRFKDSRAGRQLYYPLVWAPAKKGRKFCWKTSTFRSSFLAVPKHNFSEKRHPLFQDFIQECTVSVLKVFKWLFKIHTSFLIWFLSAWNSSHHPNNTTCFFYKLFLQTLCL